MVDKITPEHRSWNMSRVRSKDTKLEVKVRSLLHGLGFRFRKNVKALPGKPDIVLAKYRTIIFVNGCFWHQHPGCVKSHIPKSNVQFWRSKLDRTVERDQVNRRLLEEKGWKVFYLWECESLDLNSLIEVLRRFMGAA
ncbi:MAG: very short patch repair endonuclease [Acidobacteriota bacterium]|nr:very short patch repair endonuclease [Acidobacteriota bacterium]